MLNGHVRVERARALIDHQSHGEFDAHLKNEFAAEPTNGHAALAHEDHVAEKFRTQDQPMFGAFGSQQSLTGRSYFEATVERGEADLSSSRDYTL